MQDRVNFIKEMIVSWCHDNMQLPTNLTTPEYKDKNLFTFHVGYEKLVAGIQEKQIAKYFSAVMTIPFNQWSDGRDEVLVDVHFHFKQHGDSVMLQFPLHIGMLEREGINGFRDFIKMVVHGYFSPMVYPKANMEYYGVIVEDTLLLNDGGKFFSQHRHHLRNKEEMWQKCSLREFDQLPLTFNRIAYGSFDETPVRALPNIIRLNRDAAIFFTPMGNTFEIDRQHFERHLDEEIVMQLQFIRQSDQTHLVESAIETQLYKALDKLSRPFRFNDLVVSMTLLKEARSRRISMEIQHTLDNFISELSLRYPQYYVTIDEDRDDELNRMITVLDQKGKTKRFFLRFMIGGFNGLEMRPVFLLNFHVYDVFVGGFNPNERPEEEERLANYVHRIFTQSK